MFTASPHLRQGGMHRAPIYTGSWQQTTQAGIAETPVEDGRIIVRGFKL